MMDALALPQGTLVLRPSVFVFMAVHCWTAGRVLGHVPFFDPLSFPFLAWAAYALALAVTCFVLDDVIVDPLAVRGDRRFLGKIFECLQGGACLGVPLSNFAGWVVELPPGRAARAWQRETSHP